VFGAIFLIAAMVVCVGFILLFVVLTIKSTSNSKTGVGEPWFVLAIPFFIAAIVCGVYATQRLDKVDGLVPVEQRR
jgi:cytochrome c biogenesis factor